jgi:hypothetical protein
VSAVGAGFAAGAGTDVFEAAAVAAAAGGAAAE